MGMRETPEAKHNRHLRRTYGITLADYDAMFQRQGGVCAICGRPERRATGRKRKPTGNRLHVDHDHKMGGIRALLCSGCNTALGAFDHDPYLLEQAIKYLQTHDAASAWKIG